MCIRVREQSVPLALACLFRMGHFDRVWLPERFSCGEKVIGSQGVIIER